eukprot:362732-Chlamydomonas_euryale.AAC.1
MGCLAACHVHGSCVEATREDTEHRWDPPTPRCPSVTPHGMKRLGLGFRVCPPLELSHPS